jgi:hypothetical protein
MLCYAPFFRPRYFIGEMATSENKEMKVTMVFEYLLCVANYKETDISAWAVGLGYLCSI